MNLIMQKIEIQCNARWLLRLTALSCLTSRAMYFMSISVNGYRKFLRFISYLFLIFLTGCFYASHNFGEQLNALNTELDGELRKARESNICFDKKYPKSAFQKLQESDTEKRMKEIFMRFFPIKTSLQKIIGAMQSQGGATCKAQINKNNIDITICAYKHEYINGMKELGLTGWKIYLAQWQQDDFEFKITSKDNMMLDVEAKIIDTECYEIDIDSYENLNAVKLIRKLP